MLQKFGNSRCDETNLETHDGGAHTKGASPTSQTGMIRRMASSSMLTHPDGPLRSLVSKGLSL